MAGHPFRPDAVINTVLVFLGIFQHSVRQAVRTGALEFRWAACPSAFRRHHPSAAPARQMMAEFRVGNERIEPKTISGTPRRGVSRFKRVPLDLKHLGLGGARNRLGLQQRGLDPELIYLQQSGARRAV